jgi:murein DD-endopeptidase MepM/ murein hydrolase activator NlpD
MRKSFWVSITLGLTAYLLLPLPGLSAPLSSKIEKKRGEIKTEKKKEVVLSNDIEGFDGRINGLEGEISSLQNRQQAAQATLDRKRAELLRVRDKLERAKDRLARLKQQLREGQEALAARLVEIYKADEPDALTVVLTADGFADLLERADTLERISEQDQRVVDRVRRLKKEAAEVAKELAKLERQARDAANEILAKRNEIASAKNRVASTRGNLAETRDERRGVLRKVRNRRGELQEDLAALERENAKVTGQLQNSASSPGAGPVKKGSGNLIWPVNGPVTSPFGMRWGRLHAGIDIGSPSGTPIRAADSGRVVVMGMQGGYGNFTCVQHSGSMSTCYAHQSRFGTSQGASVSQGQVIGYVGCTGSCFGDHLHFEVRINGSPTDPLGHL